MISSTERFSHLKDLAQGFCLGVANIIPGVSGGTFLLIFGIYQRVFNILNQINPALVADLIRLLGGILFCRRGSLGRMAFFLKEKDFYYLVRLGLGTAVAILGLSGLMKYLLLNHFVVTYAHFFGLILISLVIPVRMFKTLRWALIIPLLAGTLMTMGVSWSVNPYDKVKFKSDRLAAAYGVASHGTEATDKGQAATPSGKYGPRDYLFIFICGAVAISATVLPGISGALVLILMGAYFDVIAALADLRAFHLDTLAFLSAFALGVVLGGLLFSRLVSFVLARYFDVTMAFLTGLMLGSLHALWPFKQAVVMARQFVRENSAIQVLENVTVYTNINRLPLGGDPLFWAFLAFAVGCLVMAAFVRAETRA